MRIPRPLRFIVFFELSIASLSLSWWIDSWVALPLLGLVVAATWKTVSAHYDEVRDADREAFELGVQTGIASTTGLIGPALAELLEVEPDIFQDKRTGQWKQNS